MPPTSTKASVYPDDISGFLCLPPGSDDLQVIWSRAELTEDLDDHPQLINTFGFFPYPSMPEIALLSLRLGLQMEKVKNWFMVQRVRCGISWGPEEIEEVRARLNYSQEQLHFKPLIALAKKSNVLRSEEFSVRTLKARARQAMASQACSSPGYDATSPGYDATQPKRMKLNCKLPDKEPVSVNASTPVNKRKCSRRDIIRNVKSHSPILPRQDLGHLVKPSDSSVILGMDGREINSVISYYPSEEEQTSSSWHVSNGEVQVAGYIDQNGNLKREDNVPGTRRQRKSKQQLQILKAFFLKCQWATREDYMRLEEISGLPRADIIQWFGDTRYALKHGQLRWFRNSMQECPSWLEDSQHMSNDSQHKSNGQQSETGSPAQVISAAIEVPDDDDVIATDDVIASSSQHSGNTVVSEEISDDEPTFSGKPTFSGNSIPDGTIANFTLRVKNCSNPRSSPSPPPVSIPLQKKYEVLDRYFYIKRYLHEEDLGDLVTESGLSPRQVVEWFSARLKHPNEVEICVVEDDEEQVVDDEDYDLDGEGEEEEEEIDDDDDDDDVVIQD